MVLKIEADGWAWCPLCDDEEISPKRLALGYETCLACGDKVATRRIAEREKSVMPTHNKGGFAPISSTADANEVRREILGRTGKGREHEC